MERFPRRSPCRFSFVNELAARRNVARAPMQLDEALRTALRRGCRHMLLPAFALLVLLAPKSLFAHGSDSEGALPVWTEWFFDPWIVVALAVSAGLYRRGLRFAPGIRRWEAVCFGTGWIVLAVAVVSPLHTLGELLFSAHMVQHELLMLGAAPLMILGRPLVPFLLGMPRRWQKPASRWTKSPPVQFFWRQLTNPLAAWALHGAALWIWHIPALFQATLRSDLVHTAQHLSFFLSALLFWWALVRGPLGRAGHGAAVLYVFTIAVHSSALGALLTFAPGLLYPIYASTAEAWGLAAIEDQQLAGLIMWVPSGALYLTIGLLLFLSWLQASDPSAAQNGLHKTTLHRP